MKRILALILVLVMSISYTAFAADEPVIDEDIVDEEVPLPEEIVIEEPTETEEENADYEDVNRENFFEDTSENTDISVNTNTSAQQGKIKVYVNGRRILFDAEPMLVNSRTMVPVRAIFEALGATVTWDNDTSTAKGVLGSTVVEITIGENYLLKNGTAAELDSPAFLMSGRTYVPARAIAESYDCTVEWDNDKRAVIIKSN